MTDNDFNNESKPKGYQICHELSGSNKKTAGEVVHTNKATNKNIELEYMLNGLDNSLNNVLNQMESVKRSRDELLLQTKQIKQNLEIRGGKPDLDEERAKRLETMTLEMKKRENIVKELEKREILLSHSMLGIINNWAEELESNVKGFSRHTPKTPENN